MLMCHIFLQTVENNWYKEMFYIMFLTGMRIGEVGGLKWSDVDFENECIHINQSMRQRLLIVREQRKPNIFEDVYPRALRHTFCSRCFEKGMNPKVVQALMGHQHYSTTIEIDTHVTEQKFDEEITKFGSAIS